MTKWNSLSASLLKRLKLHYQMKNSIPALAQARSFTTSEGHRPAIVHKRSLDILHDPWFNKVSLSILFRFRSHFLSDLLLLFCVGRYNTILARCGTRHRFLTGVISCLMEPMLTPLVCEDNLYSKSVLEELSITCCKL